jgi:hypothetical protein
MRLLYSAVFCCVATASGAQAPAPRPFAPLAFLVGHCWIGTFPGGKQTDEHCYDWMFDQKFIRDRHVVRGGDPYQGETIYSWNTDDHRITFSYYSSAGDVMTGAVENTPTGLVFPSSVKTKTGTTEIKSIWTRPTEDSYHVWVGQRSDSSWTVMWTMDFKRKN